MNHRILLISMLVGLQMLNAQNNPSTKQAPKKRSITYGDLNLSMGIPMINYKETTTSLPFGGTFNVIHQPTSYSPVLFGGGFTYLHAGGQRLNRTLSADITANGLPIPGFPPLVIPLQFRMNNHIINGHGMVRIQGPWKTVKPYIDILGGFNYLWTSTAVYDNSPQRYFATTNDDGLIDRQTQISSFTWSAGFGAGVYIYLNEEIYLNLNASYLGGGWAKYFDRNQVRSWDVQLNTSFNGNPEPGSLNADNINVNTIPKNSRTDMLYAQLGLGLNLSSSGKSANTARSTQGAGNQSTKPKPPYRK
jgi:hypothetical protein